MQSGVTVIASNGTIIEFPEATGWNLEESGDYTIFVPIPGEAEEAEEAEEVAVFLSPIGVYFSKGMLHRSSI